MPASIIRFLKNLEMEIRQKNEESKRTSAHALGRTKRPIRPASLALRTFSNNGIMVQLAFKLEDAIKVKKTS